MKKHIDLTESLKDTRCELVLWAETMVPVGAAAAPATAPGPAPFVGRSLLLSPARHGTDGFFAAILERRKKP